MSDILIRATFLASLAAIFSVTCARAVEPVCQAFDLQVMNPPAAVEAPGGARFVYELHMTNFARETLKLTAIETLDGVTGKVVGELRGGALGAGLGRAGLAPDEKVRSVVGPGMRAVAYLSILANTGSRLLRHRVTFEAANGAECGTIEGGETAIDGRTLRILGPPLRGGPWVAVFHPAWERGHRRVIYAVDGKARIPGRFAIDWMRARNPEPAAQSSGLGADVLAVADACVVAARGDFEQPKDDNAPIPLQDGNGNFVTLDLGEGRYAFYEHLAKGVRVKAGDCVKEGDVIGALGATGHVTRPHLHFHIADASAPLAAEGLPYALADFRVLGAYESIEAFQHGEMWKVFGGAGSDPDFTFPSPMMVIAFPGSDK